MLGIPYLCVKKRSAVLTATFTSLKNIFVTVKVIIIHKVSQYLKIKLLSLFTLLTFFTSFNRLCFRRQEFITFLSILASCKDPGRPKNGVRHGNEFGHNKRISFSCQPAFQMTGSSAAVCINGKWSASVPRCIGTDALFCLLCMVFPILKNN